MLFLRWALERPVPEALSVLSRRQGVSAMKNSFTPIRLEKYVDLHLRANPEVDRTDLIERLQFAIDAYKKGIRCRCGAPLWIIGSAEVGLACFTCITYEAVPDHDYEIDVAEAGASQISGITTP
jgi:hypothetical protein